MAGILGTSLGWLDAELVRIELRTGPFYNLSFLKWSPSFRCNLTMHTQVSKHPSPSHLGTSSQSSIRFSLSTLATPFRLEDQTLEYSHRQLGLAAISPCNLGRIRLQVTRAIVPQPLRWDQHLVHVAAQFLFSSFSVFLLFVFFLFILFHRYFSVVAPMTTVPSSVARTS